MSSIVERFGIANRDFALTDTVARHRARWRLAIVAVVVLVIAGALWRFTPLAQWITPQRLSNGLATFRDEPWAPIAIVGLFVIGGLIAFPLMLLVGVTALVLDPLMAFVVSLSGSLASALATYAVGASVLRDCAHTAFGPLLKRVSLSLANRGIIAIAVIRNLPIAPFTVVNLAAGSIGVRLRDYLLGTALGLIPGLIAITAFGKQLRAVLDNPTMPRIATLLAIIVGWIVLSLWVQRTLSARELRRQSSAAAVKVNSDW